MSSEITISVTVKPYILQWISVQYGTPARFPKRSYINCLIRELIAKVPKNVVPKPTNDNLIIELPFFAGKDVRHYNWLSENSKQELASSLRQIFYFSMFENIDWNKHQLKMNTGSAIRLFMEKYDIDEEYFETLKKKEYRRRRKKVNYK
jgi:hypothetical protein